MHMHSCVQCTRVLADVTCNAIHPFHKQMHNKAKYEPPTELPKINDHDWAKMIDLMEEYLCLILGERYLTLAYVNCITIELPVGEDPSTRYVAIKDEMVSKMHVY